MGQDDPGDWCGDGYELARTLHHAYQAVRAEAAAAALAQLHQPTLDGG